MGDKLGTDWGSNERIKSKWEQIRTEKALVYQGLIETREIWVYARSAEDGSIIDLVQVRVYFL